MSQLGSEAATARVSRTRHVANKPTWPPEDVRKLERLYTGGAPIKQIAHEVGRSMRAVNHMRGVLGLPTRKKVGKVRVARVSVHLDDEEWNKVQRMAASRDMTVSAYIRRLLRVDGAFS